MHYTNGNCESGGEFGGGTMALAKVCRGCGICARAERRPRSLFGRLMRWHRKWCPAWAAHTKVYGVKYLASR
jgi:hypothetical protein